MTTPNQSVVQMRRRREASRRCQVLADGRRDPLSKSRPRRPIVVRAIGKDTIEFTGSDRAVAAACTAVGARYMRAPRGAAWLIHQTKGADEVMALLEFRGYRLEVTL